jgi:C-terminal processing protease CtpA/Prc
MSFQSARTVAGRSSSSAGRRPVAGLLPRIVVVALALVVLAQTVGPLGRAGAASNQGVTTLTGSVRVTSPFVLDAATDPYVLLRDVGVWLGYGEASPIHQILGGVDGDVADEATYAISLPIAPAGAFMDVSNGEGDGEGVQIYYVQLVSDAIDDPFLGPWEPNWGLPVSSIEVDFDTLAWSGTLVVWAPDDEQLFPESAGRDGLLFTDDDPVAPLDAGWTVVSLGEGEFEFERPETAEIPLHEAVGIYQDLSNLDYVEAFDALVEDLRVRYAFKKFKETDFDEMVEEIRPLVVEAERNNDPEAFHLAIIRFGVLFEDGHVGVGIREGAAVEYLAERYGGTPGITLGETDDGEVIVVTVLPGSPADEAGIEPGAELHSWDGDDLDDALDGVELFRGASSPHGLRAHQLRLLPRMPVGTEVEFEIRNPGERRGETVELEAVEDLAGWEAIKNRHRQNLAELPVTANVLPSGVGYIRVNTFMDDVALMFDSWEWAMEKMIELEVPALIVDVRGNGGGWGSMATYFAGSFTAKRFVLTEEFMADREGEFQPAGRTVVYPSPIQWTKPVAVLIDSNCASACEIFSAAMAHNPDIEIVGHTPTAGVEAGVFPWTLPDDIYFQASIILLLDGDGEVFLEEVGVLPTIDVPVTIESLLSPEDEVVLAADEAMLDQVEDR